PRRQPVPEPEDHGRERRHAAVRRLQDVGRWRQSGRAGLFESLPDAANGDGEHASARVCAGRRVERGGGANLRIRRHIAPGLPGVPHLFYRRPSAKRRETPGKPGTIRRCFVRYLIGGGRSLIWLMASSMTFGASSIVLIFAEAGAVVSAGLFV